MPIKYLKILGWMVFLLLIYFPIFQDLDYKPVQLWDESRNANNAYEMTKNGNLLIRHFDGEPDMWELNPPLLTWFQAGSMMLFGYNELALRLPIALFVLATVFLLLHFFKTEYDNIWPGIFASLILLTSSGYIHHHIARTGDHDAVVIFFLTAASLNYFKYLKHAERKGRYLSYVTIFLILAVYTKSIVGFFALPGFFIYTIYKKKLLYVFSDIKTYVAFAAFAVVVGSYYLLREKYNPGYLEYVWNDQLFPRFSNSSDNFAYHDTGYWTYFESLFKSRYQTWIFTFLLTFVLLKYNPKKDFKDLVVFLFSISISLLLIISIGTKNYWYDGPVFPLFAIISSIGLYLLYDLIKETNSLNSRTLNITMLALGLVIYFPAYKMIIDKVYKSPEDYSFLYFGPFMKEVKEEHPEYRDYNIFYNAYNASVIFYSKVFNSEYGYDTKCIGSFLEDINVNDTILTCDYQSSHMLFDKFDLESLYKWKHCEMYVVKNLKGIEPQNDSLSVD